MQAATLTRLARPRRKRPIIGLTPLIDVVFILLIFFMLASSFLNWRAIDLSAPVRAAVAPVKSDTLKIEILPNGISVDGESASPEVLARQVADRLAVDSELLIVIQPAVAVPLQRTVTIVDQLHALGAYNLNLVRNPEAGAF